MNKRKNIKLELAEKTRMALLKEVENIDAFLAGEISVEEALAIVGRMSQSLSFGESVSWLQPYIETHLSDVQNRLKNFVDALEHEFSSLFSLKNLSDEERDRYFRRVKAHITVKLHIDGSVLLYALGRNGAAIIELHAIIERQAIEALSKQLLIPEKAEIGLRLIERLTLSDISAMLRDCGLIDDEAIKFAQRLSKLRNGLAHRNAKVISKVVYSGRNLSTTAIDFVMEEIDYIPYAIGAINFLINIIEWDDLDEDAEQKVAG